MFRVLGKRDVYVRILVDLDGQPASPHMCLDVTRGTLNTNLLRLYNERVSRVPFSLLATRSTRRTARFSEMKLARAARS